MPEVSWTPGSPGRTYSSRTSRCAPAHRRGRTCPPSSDRRQDGLRFPSARSGRKSDVPASVSSEAPGLPACLWGSGFRGGHLHRRHIWDSCCIHKPCRHRTSLHRRRKRPEGQQCRPQYGQRMDFLCFIVLFTSISCV